MTRVIVAGALANKPANAGEAWVRLSWVLGLIGLGVDTWFVEQLDPAVCVDRDGRPTVPARSENLAWFERVTREFGIAERSALIDADGACLSGVEGEALADAATAADLLVNISGNLAAEPFVSLPRSRAYVDLDPGYTQCWHRSGWLDGVLARHEHKLTVGLNIARPGSSVPTCDARWRRVMPPLVLDQWPTTEPSGELRFTTIGSWRGAYGRVDHGGRLFGQKAHEFRRFAPVADVGCGAFEAALEIHEGDRADRELLEAAGWTVVDPRRVAADPDSYRRYIQGSAAEFSPAQGIYVEMGSGWFSDRTTQYLGSSRPAVVQETSLPPELPRGEGLITFRDLDGACDAVAAVAADYAHQSRCARALAEEHFDSRTVLSGVLSQLVG